MSKQDLQNIIFSGRKAVLATMHGKEKVIAPLLKELDIEVMVPKSLNTDTFGTFTHDIKRAGNQLEAARAKAYAALTISGLDLAIASEGSFGADPQMPFVQSNLELVLLVDTKNNLEIRGHYRSSETNMNGAYITSVEEAHKHAKKWGFPEHGVIVRKDKDNSRKIFKDIVTEKDLSNRAEDLLGGFFTKKIYLETDMRADRNPTRMKNIAEATKDLIKNICSLCPKCRAPGFVSVDIKRGIPCSWCSRPTDQPMSLVNKCSKCEYTEDSLIPNTATTADPGMCAYCNP